MLEALIKPRSQVRGVLAWFGIMLGMFVLIALQPQLLEKGSETPWIGGLPFLAVLIGYFFYLRPNPIAAVAEVGRGLISQRSSLRGWVVGVIVAIVSTQVFVLVTPSGFLDRRQWLVWGPIGAGIIFGYAAYSERSLLLAGVVGCRRCFAAAATVAVGGLVVGLVAGGVFGIYAFLSRYGILGVIAVLLVFVVFQLERLNRARGKS